MPRSRAPLRICVATGIYPPDVGGPATYAAQLVPALQRQGVEVTLVRYGALRRLPGGLSHLLFLLRLLPAVLRTDAVLALDTFSVGLPAVAASRLLGHRCAVRVGGDFLWEAYVARTSRRVTLRAFYEQLPPLPIALRIVRCCTRFVTRFATHLVFTTPWQRDIWQAAYDIAAKRTAVLENCYGAVQPYPYTSKTFLWAGRDIALKNVDALRAAFADAAIPDATLEVITDAPHAELMQRVRDAYALVLPSLTDISPNFVLEGVRYGKPFLCTQETGITDRLRECGVFVDPLDTTAIAAGLRQLADPVAYEAFVARMRDVSFIRTYDDVARDVVRLFSVDA